MSELNSILKEVKKKLNLSRKILKELMRRQRVGIKSKQRAAYLLCTKLGFFNVSEFLKKFESLAPGECHWWLESLIYSPNLLTKDEQNEIFEWLKNYHEEDIVQWAITSGILSCLATEHGEEMFHTERVKLQKLLVNKSRTYSDQGCLLIYLKPFADAGSISAQKLLAKEVSELLKNDALKWMERVIFGQYHVSLKKEMVLDILTDPRSKFIEALAIDIRRRTAIRAEKIFARIDTTSPQSIIDSLIDGLLYMFSGKFKKNLFELRYYTWIVSLFRTTKLIDHLFKIIQTEFHATFDFSLRLTFNDLRELFQSEKYVISSELVDLACKMVIAISSRPNIPNESQYFTKDLLREMSDLLKCIIRGYFSSTPEGLMEKLTAYFDLIVTLNEIAYWEIYTSYRYSGIRPSRIEAKIKETRTVFKQEVFSFINEKKYYPKFTVRILDNILRIVPLTRIIPTRLRKFNHEHHEFSLNLKRIEEDNANRKDYYINLLKYYYRPLHVNALMYGIPVSSKFIEKSF